MAGVNGRARKHLLALAATAGLALAASPCHAQFEQPGAAAASADPLVQAGVPAEATAENAVVARDRALANAQRLAYERMAAATGLSPNASEATIAGLVQSLVIESERVTPTRYIARVTVRFLPGRVAAAGGRVPAGAGGSGFAGGSGPAAPAAPGTPPPGPAVATMEAVARYGSLAEWVEINRRLTAAPTVARVEVVTVATDRARLRIGLRSQPLEAQPLLAQGGLAIAAPAAPAEGWQLGLAGGR